MKFWDYQEETNKRRRLRCKDGFRKVWAMECKVRMLEQGNRIKGLSDSEEEAKRFVVTPDKLDKLVTHIEELGLKGLPQFKQNPLPTEESDLKRVKFIDFLGLSR